MRSEVKTPGLLPSSTPSGFLALPISTTYAAPMVLPTPSLDTNRTVIPVGIENRKHDEVKPLFGTDVIGPESVYFIYACVVTLVVVCSSAYGRAPTQMHRSTEQHFIWYAAVDGRVTSEHKMKIDTNADSVQEDVLPGKCLIGGADETSVPKVKLCDTVTAKSRDCNLPIPIQILKSVPSKVGEKFVDSEMGPTVSTTRGSEADSSSSDSDETDEQTHTDSIAVHCNDSHNDQHLPRSLEQSDPNMGVTEFVMSPTFTTAPPSYHITQPTQPHVHWQTMEIPPGNPPEATAKKKKRGTGKSGTKRRKASESVVEPVEETAGCFNMEPKPSQPLWSDSECSLAEEANEGSDDSHNGGHKAASATSSSDGTCNWAEETHKGHHDISSLPCQSQDQGNSTDTTTTSVGEPPPDVPMPHDDQDVTMVTAWPDTFPGNGTGVPFVLQMFTIDPQAPPPLEMWQPPVQESEVGRSEPSELAL